MAQFNIEEYETVQERLPRFFTKYPDGRVVTELKSPVDDLKTVVFQASLYNKETLLSTGWAFEKEGQGYVNKTSHLENCETSAIGRALANITIHGDKRPSKEEMQKVQRMNKQQKAPPMYVKKDGCIDAKQMASIDTVLSDKKISLVSFLKSYNKHFKTDIKTINEVIPKNYDEVLELLGA